MKKWILFLTAAALVVALGTGIALAGGGQGTPSAKTSAAASDIEESPAEWTTVLSTTIKTGEVSDLVSSVSAEAALATESGLVGSTGSTSRAKVMVRTLVDGVLASPGEVVFADRTMTVTGDLGDENNWFRIYTETRNANGFNFLSSNVGSGVHTVEMQVKTSTSSSGISDPALLALVGKRTLVVEAARLVNQ